MHNQLRRTQNLFFNTKKLKEIFVFSFKLIKYVVTLRSEKA